MASLPQYISLASRNWCFTINNYSNSQNLEQINITNMHINFGDKSNFRTKFVLCNIMISNAYVMSFHFMKVIFFVIFV